MKIMQAFAIAVVSCPPENSVNIFLSDLFLLSAYKYKFEIIYISREEEFCNFYLKP